MGQGAQLIQFFDRNGLEHHIRRAVVPGGSCLDVGPGIRPQTIAAFDRHVCLEPHREYVDWLRAAKNPARVARYVMQDTAQRALPRMADLSYDAVFLLDVIEHLAKEDGRLVLAHAERIARRQVVVFTPLGFQEQSYATGERDAWGMGGGSWQSHRSGWDYSDLPGYAIYACLDYHASNGKGEGGTHGAFYAVRTRREP